MAEILHRKSKNTAKDKKMAAKLAKFNKDLKEIVAEFQISSLVTWSLFSFVMEYWIGLDDDLVQMYFAAEPMKSSILSPINRFLFKGPIASLCVSTPTKDG